jgi:hypothetical protein
MESRRRKAPNNQCTRAATVADEEKHRSKVTLAKYKRCAETNLHTPSDEARRTTKMYTKYSFFLHCQSGFPHLRQSIFIYTHNHTLKNARFSWPNQNCKKEGAHLRLGKFPKKENVTHYSKISSHQTDPQ